MTEPATIPPPTIKQKTISLSRIEALKGIMYLKWGITSPTELSLLSELINFSPDGAPINIDHHIRNAITKSTAIPLANISTGIGRLARAGCLIKEGKTVYLNPAVRGWAETDQIMLKIQQ